MGIGRIRSIIRQEAGQTVASLDANGEVPREQLPEMVGASAVADGESGIVPQPVAGEQAETLKGDGTWSP